MRSRLLTAKIILAGVALAAVGFQSLAMQEHGGDALLRALAKSKHTLAEGIQQSAKASAVPISAKFEMDNKGQLSLSVYTAAKGLGKSAEHNVLQELAGSAESSAWTPETEVFKDVEHVARSAEQLTLMRLSSKSLLDIVKQAEKAGTVLSIMPVVDDRKGSFEVLVAAQDKVVEMAFDLDGKPLAGHREDDDEDDDKD
jgi:hypothetical protein